MRYLPFAKRSITMGSWIDTVIRFVLVSSALLLALGGISFMVVSVFKIHGKARLWICSLLITFSNFSPGTRIVIRSGFKFSPNFSSGLMAL
jgi:hypothetical protein